MPDVQPGPLAPLAEAVTTALRARGHTVNQKWTHMIGAIVSAQATPLARSRALALALSRARSLSLFLSFSPSLSPLSTPPLSLS